MTLVELHKVMGDRIEVTLRNDLYSLYRNWFGLLQL